MSSTFVGQISPDVSAVVIKEEVLSDSESSKYNVAANKEFIYYVFDGEENCSSVEGEHNLINVDDIKIDRSEMIDSAREGTGCTNPQLHEIKSEPINAESGEDTDRHNSMTGFTDSEMAYMKNCRVLLERLDVTSYQGSLINPPDDKLIKRSPKKKLYPCKYCKISSKSNKSLRLHNKFYHSHLLRKRGRKPARQKPFSCIFCGHKLSRRVIVDRHILLCHKNKLRFKCADCKFTSVWKSILRRHIIETHLKLTMYCCLHCNYKTKYKQNRNKHLELHFSKSFKVKNVKRKDVTTSRTDGNIFHCAHCTYTTPLKASLSKHLRFVHDTIDPKGPYMCDSCDYRTNHSYYLSEHEKLAHPLNKTNTLSQSTIRIVSTQGKESAHECPFCDYQNNNSVQYNYHIMSYHKGKGLYPCPFCKYCAYHNDDLLDHISIHKQDTSCWACNFVTTSKNSLHRHLFTAHNKVAGTCPLCEFKSDGIEGMVQHAHQQHDDVLFPCHLCEYITFKKDLFDRHMHFKHELPVKHQVNVVQTKKKEVPTFNKESEKPFQCGICTFRARFKKTMDSHVSTLHSRYHYPCSLCGFKSYSVKELEDHKNAHEDEEWIFFCAYCNYESDKEAKLNLHVSSTHIAVGLNHCPYCRFSSYHNYSFKNHLVLVHNVYQPFPCPCCTFTSDQIKTLLCHITAKHSQEKPYSCPHCPYTTRARILIKQHVMACSKLIDL